MEGMNYWYGMEIGLMGNMGLHLIFKVIQAKGPQENVKIMEI